MTLASRRKRRDSSAAQVNTWNVNSYTDANGSNLRTWSKGDLIGFTLALLKAYPVHDNCLGSLVETYLRPGEPRVSKDSAS